MDLTAATLQAPILMQLEYKVMLPDHLFVVAPAHKLIPLVYGACETTSKGEVSYSGDTIIRIKNAKHNTSNAFTHAHDLIELFKCRDIPQKLILIMHTAVYLFKVLKLHDLIHGVNGAGLMAFNTVEKGMTHLSNDLAGLRLRHD